MRNVCLVLLVTLLPVAAQAQPDGGAFKLQAWIDSQTGERVISSVGNSDVKLRKGYSPAAETRLIMWAEARQAGTEPPRMYLAGQRVRYTLPSETNSRGKFGRSNPKDPAYLGSPFREADLQTRWTEITCISDAHYCERVDQYEIALSPELFEALTSGDAGTDIPIALTRRNLIDWRMPKAELIATRDEFVARSKGSSGNQ